MKIMAREGLDAMLPRLYWECIQRENWDGSSEPIDQLGRPSTVHSWFQKGWAAVVESEFPDESNAARESRIPLEDGAAPKDRVYVQDSVFLEDPAFQRDCVRSWILSPHFHDDLVVHKKVVVGSSEYIRRELKMSGAKWNERQEHKQAKGEARTYQAWEAFRGDDDNRFLEHVRKLMFNEEEWLLIASRNEAQNTTIFKHLARVGAVAFKVRRRGRKGHLQTLYGVRDPSQFIELDRKVKTARCTVDPYSLDTYDFYGPEGLTSSAATQDFVMTLEELDTNQNDVERLHSQCKCWAPQRFMGHVVDLPSAAAVTMGRTSAPFIDATDLKRSSEGSDADADDEADSAPKPGRLNASTARRGGGGGAYRAYIHIHAAGVQLNAEVVAELTAQYYAMDGAEREFYVDLGRAAAANHKRGACSFRARQFYTPFTSMEDFRNSTALAHDRRNKPYNVID
jgi:hypothetical protein